MGLEERLSDAFRRALNRAALVDVVVAGAWVCLLAVQRNWALGFLVAAPVFGLLVARCALVARCRQPLYRVVALHGAQNTFQTLTYLSYYPWLRTWALLGYVCAILGLFWGLGLVGVAASILPLPWSFVVGYGLLAVPGSALAVFLNTRLLYDWGVRRPVGRAVSDDTIRKMAAGRVQRMLNTVEDKNFIRLATEPRGLSGSFAERTAREIKKPA